MTKRECFGKSTHSGHLSLAKTPGRIAGSQGRRARSLRPGCFFLDLAGGSLCVFPWEGPGGTPEIRPWPRAGRRRELRQKSAEVGGAWPEAAAIWQTRPGGFPGPLAAFGGPLGPAGNSGDLRRPPENQDGGQRMAAGRGMLGRWMAIALIMIRRQRGVTAREEWGVTARSGAGGDEKERWRRKRRVKINDIRRVPAPPLRPRYSWALIFLIIHNPPEQCTCIVAPSPSRR